MAYVTASEVLTVSGLPTDFSIVTQADVNRHIIWAESEAQKVLKVSFTVDTSTGVTVTDEEHDGDGTNEIILRNRPVNAVTALSYTRDYGSNYTTITPSLAWVYGASGRVVLKPTAESTTYPLGNKSIKVTYRHGIVPDDAIKKIILLLAGMSVLAEQSGGTYNSVTGYELPEYRVQKGEPYTSVREAFLRLREQYERALAAYVPWSVVMV